MLHQRTCKRVKSVNSFCKFILALLGKGVPLSFTFDENSPPSVNHPVVRYYLVTHTGRRRGPAGRTRWPSWVPRERCLPAPLPAIPRRDGAMKYYAVESTIITLTICRSGFRRRTRTLAWSGRIFLRVMYTCTCDICTKKKHGR